MSGDKAGSPKLAGIYVASRVKHAAMWKQYRDAGTPIIASWIDEAGEGETVDFGELWQRIREEIGRSKALIFYAERGDDPWKGALVEVGVALALGKPVYVVLHGIVPEGRTLRPIGSWLLDRNVKVWEELDDALIKAILLPSQDVAHDEGTQEGLADIARADTVQDLQHRLFRKIAECAKLEAELRTLRSAPPAAGSSDVRSAELHRDEHFDLMKALKQKLDGNVHKEPFSFEMVGGRYRIRDANDNALCFCYSEGNAEEVVRRLNSARSAIVTNVEEKQ
jgi:hypothetical protein